MTRFFKILANKNINFPLKNDSGHSEAISGSGLISGFHKTHCYSVPLIVGEDYDGIGQVIGKLHRFRNRLGC